MAIACDRPPLDDDITDIDGLPRLALHEELRIGSVHDADVGFTLIGQIHVVGGNLFVVEARAREVREYDSAGRLLRAFGGEGGSPGAFRSVSGIGVFGDTLWVGDNVLRRVTLFTRAGKLIATVNAPVLVDTIDGIPMRMIATTYLRDGTLTGSWSELHAGVSAQEVRMPRLVVNAAGLVVDTAGFRLGWIRPRSRAIRAGNGMVVIPELEAQPMWSEASSGGWWTGRGAASDAKGFFDIVRFGTDLDTVFARRFRYTAVRYDEAYADSLGRWYSSVQFAPVQPAPAVVAKLIRENVVIPEFKEPLVRAWSGQDGSLWLLRNTETPTKDWIVLDADGTASGRITLPRGANPEWSSGDVVWASVPDSLDVPWLVRYRLQRQ